MLLSNLGLATNAHYCMGRLMESTISWGITDLQCGMEKAQASCENMSGEQQEHENMDDCCDNEHQIIQSDEELTTPSLLITFQPVLTAIILYVFTVPASKDLVKHPRFNYHSPPLPVPDLQVLYQSFLI